MSGSEPLVVGLEEGLKLLAERRDGRRISYEVDTPDGKPCWVAWQGWTVLGPADSLEDALEIALEQPVVARDEAAELRAALTELVAFFEESIQPPRSIGSLPKRQRIWLLAARRILATSEGQP